MAVPLLQPRTMERNSRVATVVWAAFGIFTFLLTQNAAAQSAERRYACWGSFGPPVVSAQCPRNTVIQVLRAGLKVQNHGGLCAYNEHDCGCEYGESGCQMPDVRQLCMGRPACRLDVTQQYISTPSCKGFSDYMYIEFNCVQVEQGSVSEICSAVETSSEHGFLRSPNYPSLTRAQRECDCTLTTDNESSIALTILDIQTLDYKCDTDKLQVAYDGRTDTYCGQRSGESANKRIASKSSVVNVKFNTDGRGVGGSFWLKYQADKPDARVKLTCTYTESESPRTSTVTTLPGTTGMVDDNFLTTEKEVPHRLFPTIPLTTKSKRPKGKPKKKPWWWKYLQNPEKTKPFYRPDKKSKKKVTKPAVLVDATKVLADYSRSSKYKVPSTRATTTSASRSKVFSHQKAHEHQRQQQHPKFLQANKGKFTLPHGRSIVAEHPELSTRSRTQPKPFQKHNLLYKLPPPLKSYPSNPSYSAPHLTSKLLPTTMKHSRQSPGYSSLSYSPNQITIASAKRPFRNTPSKKISPAKSSIASASGPPLGRLFTSQPFVDKTGRRWSHLPKSLLSKLQFPVPLIKALEKELTSEPNDKTEVLSPPIAAAKYKPASFPPGKTSETLPQMHNIFPADNGKQFYLNKARGVVSSSDPESEFQIKKADAKKLSLPSHTLLPEESAHFFEKMAQFKKAMLLKESPVVKEVMTPKPHNKVKVIYARITTPPTTTTSTVPPNTTPTTVKLIASTKPPAIPITEESVTNYVMVATNRPPNKESGKLSISKNVNDNKLGKTEVIEKETKDAKRVIESGDDEKSVTVKKIKYKRPMSKELRDPFWEEPLEYPSYLEDMKPYPKIREGFKPKTYKRRRKMKKKAQKYDDDSDGKTQANEESYHRKGRVVKKIRKVKKMKVDNGHGRKKKKYKLKRIWKERPDKTKVSVVRPEPRMYVDMYSSGRKGRRKFVDEPDEDIYDYEEEIVPEEITTIMPVTSTMQPSTTPSKTKTPILKSTERPALTDSVHSDDVIVEELAGKIETVSDFYTALDEEDWTQWPAFEMVKTAQEQNGPSTPVSTIPTTTLPTTKKPKPRIIQFGKPTPEPKYHKKRRKIKKKKNIGSNSKRHAEIRTTTTEKPLKAKWTELHPVHPDHPSLTSKSLSTGESEKVKPFPKISPVVNNKNNKISRRKPVYSPPLVDHVQSKSESLTNPKDNTVTIIAACVVGALLVAAVVGLVARFVVNRKKGIRRGRVRQGAPPLPKPRRFKSPPTTPQNMLDSTNFPGQKIPRPKRI